MSILRLSQEGLLPNLWPVAPAFPASEANTSVFDKVTDPRQQENHTKVKAPLSNQIFIGQILSNKIHSPPNFSSEPASSKNSSFQDSVNKITSNLEKYNSEVISSQFGLDENFTCLEDYTRQIGENVPDGRSVYSGQGHSGKITVHRTKIIGQVLQYLVYTAVCFEIFTI